MGEHPRDGGVYVLLPVEGFVPGGVSLVACRIPSGQLRREMVLMIISPVSWRWISSTSAA